MQRLTIACRDLEFELHRLRIAMEDGGTEELRRDAERFVRELQEQIRAYSRNTGLPSLRDAS